MKKTRNTKMRLSRQTVRSLSSDHLRRVAGGSLLGFDQSASGTCDTYTCNGCYGSGSGGSTEYNY